MSDATGASRSRAAADAPPERLRRDVDTGAAQRVHCRSIGLMLDVLVAESLDDERVPELAALDDLRRRLGRHDGVVVGAGDALVETLLTTTRAGMTLIEAHVE